MKLRPLFSIFALGIVALSSIDSFAQDLSDPLNPQAQPPRIYLGPVIGYNRSMHTGEFASIPDGINDSPVPCPVFNGGTNNGFYVGGTMEYLLGDSPKDAVSSIIGKIVYNNLPASFGIDGLPYKVVGPDGTPVNTTVEHVSEVTYHTIDLEALYKLNLFGSNFGVVAGPTFGLSLGTAQQLQQFKLIEPTNAQFARDDQAGDKLTYSEDMRTITIRDGDLPTATKFRAAIKAGVQYEILNLFGSTKFIVAPHAFYNFGITKLTDGENWRVNALQTGIDFRYAF